MPSSISGFRKAFRGIVLPILVPAIALLFFDRFFFTMIQFLADRCLEQEPLAAAWRKDPPPASTSVLILGTSRTHEAIHSPFFSRQLKFSVYKEANVGRNLRYNRIFYQRFKAQIAVPRILIYGVDYFMFKMLSKENELARLGIRTTKKPVGGISWLLSRKDIVESHLTELINQANFLLSGRPVHESWRFLNRYRGLPKAEYNRLVLSPALHFTPNPYVPFPGLEGKNFLELLDECRDDGTLVFLVSIPDYHATVATNFQMGRFIDDMERLSRHYPNVFFLDYNRPDRFPLGNPLYFLDGGYGVFNCHMSQEGARLFNRMLSRDIRRIMKIWSGRDLQGAAESAVPKKELPGPVATMGTMRPDEGQGHDPERVAGLNGCGKYRVR